ncbi:hypothetical protein WMF04_11335 [Sorangium sp. So ce260]|uniref:hypothetical protein n=1 Tax=Sorangium sp. So ce260 TaxID=3133291 RepID=UPI003F5D8B67
MMADWLVVLLAAAGGVGAVGVSTRRLLAQRHHRASEVTLVCPRTGTPARCRLVADGRTGELVEITRCSLAPGGLPTCEQDCVKLLNLGIRLAPVDPARRREHAGAGDADATGADAAGVDAAGAHATGADAAGADAAGAGEPPGRPAP